MAKPFYYEITAYGRDTDGSEYNWKTLQIVDKGEFPNEALRAQLFEEDPSIEHMIAEPLTGYQYTKRVQELWLHGVALDLFQQLSTESPETGIGH